MYKVTIAIPLYNAERYIQETLLSALEQTFESIEILIIDDKSTDGSISIVKNLQQTHPHGKNIRICSHKTNQGVAMARNTAIANAMGEYFFFLDSDDLITPDCISLLYETAQTNGSDVTIGSYKETHYKDFKEKVFRFSYQNMKGKDKFISFLYSYPYYPPYKTIWNTLFKLSFLTEKRLKFDNIRKCEDTLFIAQMAPEVESYTTISDITYMYNKREGSLCQYNPRTTIPAEEIELQTYVRIRIKNITTQYIDNTYGEHFMTHAMMSSFEAACIILNKKKLIVPREVADSTAKQLLDHPLNLNKIRYFKKYKKINIVWMLLGKLPYSIQKPCLICFQYGIKWYRKLKHRMR